MTIQIHVVGGGGGGYGGGSSCSSYNICCRKLYKMISQAAEVQNK